MSSIHPLPAIEGLRQIVAMLYGNDSDVAASTPIPHDGPKTMTAVFICDNDKPVTACVFDWPFAAYAGSALTMIPPGGAEDAAKKGEFTDMMIDNVSEFMNICSRLFMNDTSPHLRLGPVYRSLADLPDDVKAMCSAAPARAGFTVEVPGYGKGELTCISS